MTAGSCSKSSVICQYLDETFPEPALMPGDPYARAQARTWLKIFDDVVHAALRQASFELLYRPLLAEMPPAELEERLALHPNPVRAQRFRDAARGACRFRSDPTSRAFLSAASSAAWMPRSNRTNGLQARITA